MLRSRWQTRREGAERCATDCRHPQGDHPRILEGGSRALKAGKELGVEVTYKGPLKEDDLKQQIDLVQSFVAQRVSGIVLAPLNDKALRGPVNSAVRSNSSRGHRLGAQGKAHTSFVATDNEKAGALVAERMGALLAPKRRGYRARAVIVLRYQEGSASTANRKRLY